MRPLTLIFFFAILLSDCSERKEIASIDDEGVHVIDLTDFVFTNPLNLSELAEEINYIKLETHRDCLIDEYHQVYMSDNTDMLSFQNRDTTFLFKEQFCDTLYCTSNFNEIHPKYIFKWESSTKLDYLTYARFFSLESKTTPYNGLYRVTNWAETDKYFFFLLFAQTEPVYPRLESHFHLGIYDQTNRTLHLSKNERIINDIDGGYDFIYVPFYHSKGEKIDIYSNKNIKSL